ncbi:MAG: hypothetical protein ACI9MR_001026 [Myxococcota bacterium]|jgi:hypothetical protein
MSRDTLPTTLVTGVGVWAMGFPDAAGWQTGTRDPAIEAPTGNALDRRSRRRASRLTRSFSDVLTEATTQANADLSTVPTVFGSSLGEAATMIKLLDQMWREKSALSPTSFAMSVHNAASGLISIAAGNRGFTTSLAADYDTVAATLFEAIGLVGTGHGPTAVTCADESAPKDLVPEAEHFDMLATALVLAPAADAQDGALATMRGPFVVAADEVCVPPSDAIGATVARNPQVGLLDLIDAVQRQRYGVIRLDRGRGRGWAVELTPPPTR